MIAASQYDDNGNLTQQIDAKGQIIQMTYDVLNRISRKDLPPNSSVAGPEDTTYFYDSELGTPESDRRRPDSSISVAATPTG